MKRWLLRHCPEDPHVITVLYRDSEHITQLHHKFTVNEFKGKGKKRQRTGGQAFYKVSWAESTILKDHLPYYAQQGYEPAPPGPATASSQPGAPPLQAVWRCRTWGPLTPADAAPLMTHESIPSPWRCQHTHCQPGQVLVLTGVCHNSVCAT